MVKIASDDDAAPRTHRAALVLRVIGFCIGVVAVVAMALALAIAGSERLRTALMEQSGATSTQDLTRAVALAPVRLVQAILAPQAATQLRLDVKFKHMHRIHEQREAALRSGVLAPSDADFVPASIEVDGRTIAAKLRLAGDRAEALAGEKWPLRIATKADDHVFGMRRFELAAPTAQEFDPVDYFLEQLRGEDVVAPRSRLVDVVLNGKHLGAMILRELPSAEMLASQQRRDGPMLRFDSPPGEAGGSQAAALAPLRPGAIADSHGLRDDFETATKLLTAQLAGDLAAGELFDVELWARFLATVEAWGAGEALAWRNLRFYYNPLTARLEPLGQAVDLGTRERGGESVVRAAPFARRLLADPRIAAAYQRAQAEVTSAMATDAFAASMREREALRLRTLQREYPLRLPFDVGALLRRVAQLREPAAAPPETRATTAATGNGHPAVDSPLPSPSLEEVLARHPFLRWDPAVRMLRATPGRIELEGLLILPDGVGLALDAGTVLHFEARSGIIARGPLDFRGREDAPVVLEGPSASKASRLWSGVYVVESDRPSHWTYVVVRNTGGFKHHGWSLPSAVVFRKSRIEFEHCAFSGDRTHDAINVVRGTFRLNDVRITDAESDGFDADYSQGSIHGGSFARIRGDAVDLGGSRLEIEGTRISRVRDKAISVGEESRLVARDLDIRHVGIGVASKNGSEAEISDSTLRNVEDVALVAYMNQPEYGPGALVATGNHISGTALPALAQTGSRVVLDGSTLRPVDAAIERLYKD